ncbi:MAG: Smr/MutS family protein, partial [Bacteroidales bacterium]|nr:Smr/MutS family protein [Bacteroidales bacterium]
IKKAKAEASDINNNSNRLIENTIREIKEAQAEKEKTRKIREKFEKQQKQALNEANETENVGDSPIPIQQNVKIPNKIRKKLSEINKAEREKQQLKDDKIKEITQDTSIADRNRKFEKLKNDFPDKAKLSSQKTTGQKDTFEVGSLVTAYNSETVGEIVEIKGKEAKVMFDNLAMSVKLEDLHLHQGAKPVRRSSNNNVNSFVQELNEKAYTFTTTIDVRGLRADEALYEIEHYMDDVIMLSIRSFSILHGRGNGVLRKLIRDYLSKIPDVAYFKDASIQNGGDGITEVRMKFNEGEEVEAEETQN